MAGAAPGGSGEAEPGGGTGGGGGHGPRGHGPRGHELSTAAEAGAVTRPACAIMVARAGLVAGLPIFGPDSALPWSQRASGRAGAAMRGPDRGLDLWYV